MRPVIPARIRPLLLSAIPVVVSILVLTAGHPAPDRGKEIFDTVCSACHTLTPPPLKAPPMIMIAGHYVQGSESEDAAREAMMRWVPAPDTARSLLPGHAVERFGRMAPLPLPSEDVEAVVNYVFSEWKAAQSPGPRCEGQGCGGGMMHRHGMQPDSNMQGMMHRRGMQPDSNTQGMMHRRGMQPDSNMQGMMHRRGAQPDSNMQGMMHRQGMQPGAGMMHRHGMQPDSNTQGMMCRRGTQSETGAQGTMCGGNCPCGGRANGGQ